MKITIETIRHEDHRYQTVGDWFYRHTIRCPKCQIESDVLPLVLECPKCFTQVSGLEITEHLVIRVSQLSDWRLESLIAVHELVEVLLCKHEGITQESVDRFDKQFEATRAEGKEDEPGDDPGAPYVKQHCTATGIERLLAAQLGVSWKDYEDELNRLS